MNSCHRISSDLELQQASPNIVDSRYTVGDISINLSLEKQNDMFYKVHKIILKTNTDIVVHFQMFCSVQEIKGFLEAVRLTSNR